MYVPSHVGPDGQSVWKAGMKRTPGPDLALTKPPSGNNAWHTIDYTPTMIVYDYIQWPHPTIQSAIGMSVSAAATKHAGSLKNPKQPRLDGAETMKESQETEPLSGDCICHDATTNNYCIKL